MQSWIKLWSCRELWLFSLLCWRLHSWALLGDWRIGSRSFGSSMTPTTTISSTTSTPWVLFFLFFILFTKGPVLILGFAHSFSHLALSLARSINIMIDTWPSVIFVEPHPALTRSIFLRLRSLSLHSSIISLNMTCNSSGVALAMSGGISTVKGSLSSGVLK